MQLANYACLVALRRHGPRASIPYLLPSLRWFSQERNAAQKQEQQELQQEQQLELLQREGEQASFGSHAGGEEMSEGVRRMLDAFKAPTSTQAPRQQTPKQPAGGEVATGMPSKQRQPFLTAAARRHAEADAAAAEAAASAAAAASTPPTDAFQVVLRAVENCKPLMKLSQIKTGSKVSYVPIIITPAEQRSLALRWILEAARKRKQAAKLKTTSLADCLAAELMLAAQCRGAAREKRDALHKLALENRAMLMRV